MVQFTRSGMKKALLATALVTAVGAAWAQPVKIAIATFGDHPQLNDSIAGFKKQLAAEGYVEGKDVTYQMSHTNFDLTLVPQMIAKLKADKPKLMFTITTPVTQVAKKALAGSGIPVIFAAVTDPVAAKLTPSWEAGDTGITGASDLQDMGAVMNFAHSWCPAQNALACLTTPARPMTQHCWKNSRPPPRRKTSPSSPSVWITPTIFSSAWPRSRARPM